MALKTPKKREKGKLTPKQEKFVAEYLTDLNATQAAIRAGYSEKTAFVQGCKLLSNPKLASILQERQSKRLAKLEITAERLDQEAARLAFFDIRKIYRPDGSLIPLHELDEDTARALSGVDVSVTGNEKDGFQTVYKFKTASKEKGLELLYKRFGLLQDQVVQNIIISVRGGGILNQLLNPEENDDSGKEVIDADNG